MKRILSCTIAAVLGTVLLLLGAAAQEEYEPGGEPAPPKKAPSARPAAKAAPKAAPKVAPKAAPKSAPKGAPTKGSPKAKGPEGEEEGEEKGIFVLLDSDAVVLRDGTRINGTILAAGQTAVTILTHEGEKTIPRENIERIIKNADAETPRKFVPEELDGHKYLRDIEGALPPPPPKAQAPKGPDIVPIQVAAAPPKAVEPPPPPPKAPEPLPPVAPKAQPPVAPAPQPKAPGEAPPGVKQLPPITFPKTQVEIHALIEKLRREGTLNDYLADPKFREGFREAVREAFKNEAPKGE